MRLLESRMDIIFFSAFFFGLPGRIAQCSAPIGRSPIGAPGATPDQRPSARPSEHARRCTKSKAESGSKSGRARSYEAGAASGVKLATGRDWARGFREWPIRKTGLAMDRSQRCVYVVVPRRPTIVRVVAECRSGAVSAVGLGCCRWRATPEGLAARVAAVTGRGIAGLGVKCRGDPRAVRHRGRRGPRAPFRWRSSCGALEVAGQSARHTRPGCVSDRPSDRMRLRAPGFPAFETVT